MLRFYFQMSKQSITSVLLAAIKPSVQLKNSNKILINLIYSGSSILYRFAAKRNFSCHVKFPVRCVLHKTRTKLLWKLDPGMTRRIALDYVKNMELMKWQKALILKLFECENTKPCENHRLFPGVALKADGLWRLKSHRFSVVPAFIDVLKKNRNDSITSFLHTWCEEHDWHSEVSISPAWICPKASYNWWIKLQESSEIVWLPNKCDKKLIGCSTSSILNQHKK